MLAKPNVNDLMEKTGNRYEAVVAIAKRAREIAEKRIKDESKDITDPVDVASKEICDGTVKVRINGELCGKEDDKDLDSVISATVEGILKDLEKNSLERAEVTEKIEEVKKKRKYSRKTKVEEEVKEKKTSKKKKDE